MNRAALDIQCRYCHAPPGQPCHNKITNQPLQFHTHPCRVTDAQTNTTANAEELF